MGSEAKTKALIFTVWRFGWKYVYFLEPKEPPSSAVPSWGGGSSLASFPAQGSMFTFALLACPSLCLRLQSGPVPARSKAGWRMLTAMMWSPCIFNENTRPAQWFQERAGSLGKPEFSLCPAGSTFLPRNDGGDLFLTHLAPGRRKKDTFVKDFSLPPFPL